MKNKFRVWYRNSESVRKRLRQNSDRKINWWKYSKNLLNAMINPWLIISSSVYMIIKLTSNGITLSMSTWGSLHTYRLRLWCVSSTSRKRTSYRTRILMCLSSLQKRNANIWWMKWTPCKTKSRLLNNVSSSMRKRWRLEKIQTN